MRSRKCAFTLLELLVVISILTLLISILFPALSAARRHAKANVCLSHLKVLGNAFAIYLNENEDRFPPYRLYRPSLTSEDVFINGYGRLAPRWQWFVGGESEAVINPTPFQLQIDRVGYFDDYSPPRTTGAKSATTMSTDSFSCPSLADDRFTNDVRDGAFGYNYQYLGNTRHDKIRERWDNFAVGLHQIRKLAATVVVADSRGAGRSHGRHSFTLDPPRLATEKNAGRFGPNIHEFTGDPRSGDLPRGLDAVTYAYSPVEPRHTGRGNVLFADSHAAALTPTELGYEISDGSAPADDSDGGTPAVVPKGTPVPNYDASTGTASNRLWNGQAVDRIAREQRVTEDDG